MVRWWSRCDSASLPSSSRTRVRSWSSALMLSTAERRRVSGVTKCDFG